MPKRLGNDLTAFTLCEVWTEPFQWLAGCKGSALTPSKFSQIIFRKPMDFSLAA